MPGMTLVLAGTPIGRIDDASPRLASELAAADLVAAEDTRRLRRLATELGVTLRATPVSYFDGNEVERAPALLEALLSGSRVVLVTDAGMPSVSDPGYRLVAAAVEAGVPVTVVPGPSAVLAALAVSGLPSDRFCFEGFLPRRGGDRSRRIRELAGERRTMVLFESPHRIVATLATMVVVLGGDRRMALCRELTKTYEEVRRGTVSEVLEWAESGVRGEITLVVAGASGEQELLLDALALKDMVDQCVEQGMSRKDAVAAVAARTGVSRREVYAAGHG